MPDDDHGESEKLHNSSEKLHNSSHMPGADDDQPAETDSHNTAVQRMIQAGVYPARGCKPYPSE